MQDPKRIKERARLSFFWSRLKENEKEKSQMNIKQVTMIKGYDITKTAQDSGAYIIFGS